MLSINFIAHVFSGVTLLGMFYFLVRFQRERDFLRSLLRSTSHHSVYVDWPGEFLRKYSRALNIPIHGKGDLKTPVKIDRRPFLELACSFGVSSVHIRKLDESLRVEFYLKKRAVDVPKLIDELSQAIHADVFIVEAPTK